VNWRFVVVAGVGIGCGTPYQPKGFSGGYSDTELGAGRYSVDVQVNSFTSQGTALEYAHRRAGDLCPAGYDVIDGSKSQSDFYIRSGNTLQNAPKANVALIVECRRAVVAASGRSADNGTSTPQTIDPFRANAPATPPSTRVVKTDTRPMYCSIAEADHDEGVCSLDVRICNERREQVMLKSGAQYRDCAPAAGAACFNANGLIDGGRRTFCLPSVKTCEAALIDARSNPDLTVTAPRCGVYRVQNFGASELQKP
jgi:hypothetical protein